ncbi:MAG: low molecular weight phosphotyrosine protein phosphatase [Solirubrobacterales bacterium]|nr:low molecular weight phosphotyrosine protein phosphatase [Solirubrobacterales bacterium]
MRILFVCLGNICRSPSAEAVMRGLIEREGLEGFEIDSAGTGDWHVGSPADPRAIAAATERGVAIGGTARQVEPADFGYFDLILAMDRSNHANLLAMEGADPEKVRLFREMAGEGDLDVPDPYYGGEDGFDEVLDILERGSVILLETVRR